MSAAPRPRETRPDVANAGLFLRGIDPARMDTDGRVLLLALVASLFLHALVIGLLYGHHLGRVDPAMLGTELEIVHIQRAIEDKVVEDDSAGPPIMAANPNIQATRPPPPAELVDQALKSTEADPKTTVRSPNPILATPLIGPRVLEAGPLDPGRAGGLRDAAHLGGSGDPLAPVGMAAGQGGNNGPKVNLPPTLTAPPTLNSGVELPFTGPARGDPRLSVNGGALVPGPGQGKSVDGKGVGGSGLARDVLADQSTVPGVSLGKAPLEPTRLDDSTTGSLPMPRSTLPTAPTPRVDIQTPVVQIPTNQLDNTEHLDEDFDYALSVIEPAAKERGYLRVDITPKQSLRRLKTMPKDVVFLVDTSLSIPQEWVNGVISGVRESLGTLNREDRFNIVLFSQSPSFFSTEGVQPATDANIQKADDFLTHARAAGLTDVNQAMGRLLVRDVAVQRVYDLVLISDGKPTDGIKDTRELINLLTRDNDLAASIYCVGIGEDPNHELLDFLAYRNKGFSVYAPSEKRTPTVVRDLLGRIRYPIIKNMRVDVAGIDPNNVFPRDLPDIHQGETFSVYGRWDKADLFTMRFAGRNGPKLVDLTFKSDLARGAKADKKLPRDWAFWKLYHLYSQLIIKGETPEIRAQIDALRKEYGLKTVY